MDNQNYIPQIRNDDLQHGDGNQLNTEITYVQTCKFSIDCENWMGNLPDYLTAAPLIYLSIPGSHNSFSYSISPKSGVSPDSPPFVQSLGKCLKLVTAPFIYKWSKGQGADVTRQLKAGVRYFDVRLVVKDCEIYIAHGLYGGLIQTFLEEISLFLDLHSKEVVILDFQHFYEFRLEHHEKLMALITTVFQKKICRRQRRMKENTLNLLWHHHQQVIIIYRHMATRFNDCFWPSAIWCTKWPDTVKVPDLISYLNKNLGNRKPGVGFVSQGILTPNPKYIVFHVFGSLKKMSSPATQNVISWLKTKHNGARGVNVVISDFVERYDFCEEVISLNYKKICDYKQHFDTSDDFPVVRQFVVEEKTVFDNRNIELTDCV